MDKALINYVKECIGMDRVRYISGQIEKHHSSLPYEDSNLYDDIESLIADYDDENDTDNSDLDIEEVFLALMDEDEDDAEIKELEILISQSRCYQDSCAFRLAMAQIKKQSIDIYKHYLKMECREAGFID